MRALFTKTQQLMQQLTATDAATAQPADSAPNRLPAPAHSESHATRCLGDCLFIRANFHSAIEAILVFCLLDGLITTKNTICLRDMHVSLPVCYRREEVHFFLLDASNQEGLLSMLRFSSEQTAEQTAEAW